MFKIRYAGLIVIVIIRIRGVYGRRGANLWITRGVPNWVTLRGKGGATQFGNLSAENFLALDNL